MNDPAHLVVSAAILVTGVIVFIASQSLVQTTLTSARLWIALVVTTWTAAWFADESGRRVSDAIADHLWYAAAVFALCPPIAVLGSRRPGNKVWGWFVLFPLLLVLGWPVGALWMQGSEIHGLQLETPQVVAFCLVLIMGVGNYVGTRFTLSACLYGLAAALIAISSSVVVPAVLEDRSRTRFWCTVLMILSVAVARLSVRRAAVCRFDRLWFDFFDTFGIVWARRIQDRVNHITQAERLPARLELDGFVWSSTPEQRKSPTKAEEPTEAAQTEQSNQRAQETEMRIEHILRWLLRRFVDPPWIDARIGVRVEPTVGAMSVDS